MSHKFKGNVQVESNLILSNNTANRVPVLDGSKNVVSSSVTDTELGYVSGVTSGIQSQLNNKASDADVIKKDGSVTYTGNQPMGGNKITGLGAPTTNGDALRYDQLGANNGIATLDGSGKVPVSQLPSAVMTYEGVWNASTNSPTLADGVGDAGQVYRVGTAGTQNLGSGSISFDVGDYVIYNGTIWEKSDTTDAVASVNGQTGIVSLDSDDISEGATNLYFSDERAQDAVGAMVDDSSKVSLTYTDGTPSLVADIIAGSLVNADINASAAIDATKIHDGSVSNTEFGYLNGVTSDIQTQLNDKASTTLNNLGTTSINANLLPDSQVSRNIGSDSNAFNVIKAFRYSTSATIQSFTGDTTSGSAVIAVTDTTGLYVGQEVVGTGIPVGATISSIVANTSVTMDANSTATNTGITFSAGFGAALRSENQTGSNPSFFLGTRTGNVQNGTSGGATYRTGDVSGTGNSGSVTVRSGNHSSGSNANTTGNVALNSGNNSGSGNSGTTTIRTGTVTSGTSGAATYSTGSATSGNSGITTVSTGNSTTGSSGNLNVTSGTVSSGSGTSGNLSLSTGATNSGNSGDIHIATGASTSGTRGTVRFTGNDYHFTDGKAVKLFNSTNTTYIGLQPPLSAFTSTDYTLPEDGSSGQVLATQGDGTLYWTAVAAASSGDINETSFSLANNQASPANVTGFAFANATVRSFEALVSVNIDATSDLFEVFTLRGIQRGADWDMSVVSNGDDSLVSFSITNAGQVQYTSGNYSGFSSGAIKFRAITTSVA